MQTVQTTSLQTHRKWLLSNSYQSPAYVSSCYEYWC